MILRPIVPQLENLFATKLFVWPNVYPVHPLKRIGSLSPEWLG
ncbi:hypothetical protein A2U01_0051524, partial [Trifolium medium]|nr:hypothetical protein [Trifolium medium]